MSFHLAHPSLSLNGRRKGKVKFRNADEARKARELDASWKELLKNQGLELEEKRRKRALAAEPLVYKLNTPVGRTNTHHIPSRVTEGHDTSSNVKVYTGTEIIGISQMAKSNAVPVFNHDHIIDITRMRR
jgi:hypothetical protein